MANSYAQPILRTGDLAKALRVARRLLELADTSSIEVDFEAIARTPQELNRLLARTPEAEWWACGPDRSGSSDDGDLPSDRLPVFLRDLCRPVSTVEAFLSAAGSAPVLVRWDFGGWPAAPEIGLGPGGTPWRVRHVGGSCT
jgi:hypothetical protein